MAKNHQTIETAGVNRHDFFGHPRGLSFLFATEMWERFSFYGMRSLLVLYMIKYLLLPGEMEKVLGYGALAALLRSIFGKLDVQPMASLIYGLYSGLVYLTPIFGGLLADSILGQRRTVIIGALFMASGHFMMAFEPLFLAALLMLILGNGCFKPNISTQVGRLYAKGDSRRDRAYSIFYVGINLGAFLAPLVCGTLGEKAGWDYGFMAAGVGMLIGLGIYLFALRTLPPDNLERRRAVESITDGQASTVGAQERHLLYTLALICIPVIFFWATYEQQGNTIVLWANTFTERTVDLVIWKGEIPTTWFLATNPLLIFLLTPLIVARWKVQAARGREPSTVAKMSMGCLGVALAYAILTIAAWHVGPHEKASPLWLVAYFVVLTIGELYLSPIGLSLFSSLAPSWAVSAMMGLWLATSFPGNLIAGWLGGFWEVMKKPYFFMMIAFIAGAASLSIWICGRPLARIIDERQRQEKNKPIAEPIG